MADEQQPNEEDQPLAIDEISGETCPVCAEKTLTLREIVRDIPYFGIVHIFSMQCSGCGYKKTDLESEEERKPAKYTFDVESEEDLTVRIVKSAEATLKIPRIITIEPGDAANGYVTNVEGVINKVKEMIETAKEGEDDKDKQKKAKNQIKKLNKVLWGSEKLQIIIEDPSGNSAIVSDKAKQGPLK